jgi:hypothetical protein
LGDLSLLGFAICSDQNPDDDFSLFAQTPAYSGVWRSRIV